MPGPRPTVRDLAVRAIPAVRRLVQDRQELRAECAELRERLRRSEQAEHQARARLDNLVQASVAGGPDTVRGGWDDLQYLFIVTYGRSGSTLLQGILDSTPGYLVRGENDNAVFRLFQYQRQLARAHNRWVKKGPLEAKDAWFGIDRYPVEAGISGLRALLLTTVLRPRPDTRVTGFKEIRWWAEDWQQYLDFLRQVFPGARFVINVRDHEAVSRSKWWAENQDALARLDQYERRLDDIAAYLGDAAYRVNFDEFVADHEVLRGLFDWLGEPFDRQRVDATMAVKHSS